MFLREQRVGVRGWDCSGFDGQLIGCCVYVAVLECVCIHTLRRDVCGMWVGALGRVCRCLC